MLYFLFQSSTSLIIIIFPILFSEIVCQLCSHSAMWEGFPKHSLTVLHLCYWIMVMQESKQHFFKRSMAKTPCLKASLWSARWGGSDFCFLWALGLGQSPRRLALMAAHPFCASFFITTCQSVLLPQISQAPGSSSALGIAPTCPQRQTQPQPNNKNWSLAMSDPSISRAALPAMASRLCRRRVLGLWLQYQAPKRLAR